MFIKTDIVIHILKKIDMIDGPHRSLSMPRHWKSFAMRADKKAFSMSESAEYLYAAIIKDWKKEISISVLQKITQMLDSNQFVIFEGQEIEQLKLYRKESSGYVMRITLLDYLIDSLSTSPIKHNRLHEAFCSAISDHMMRRIRQIQEHYVRESGQNRAYRVIERMQSSVSELGIEEIANDILDLKLNRTPKKRNDLDDGVDLQ